MRMQLNVKFNSLIASKEARDMSVKAKQLIAEQKS